MEDVLRSFFENLANILDSANANPFGVALAIFLSVFLMGFFLSKNESEKFKLLVYISSFIIAIILFSSASFLHSIIIDKNPQITKQIRLSQDFILGRWRVEQAFGDISSVTVTSYEQDGTCSGYGYTTGFQGQRQNFRGEWKFRKISSKKFQLEILFENQKSWSSTFAMINENKIHNIDENYMAIREQ